MVTGCPGHDESQLINGPQLKWLETKRLLYTTHFDYAVQNLLCHTNYNNFIGTFKSFIKTPCPPLWLGAAPLSQKDWQVLRFSRAPLWGNSTAVNNSVPLAQYVDFPPSGWPGRRSGVLSRPQAELCMHRTAAGCMKPMHHATDKLPILLKSVKGPWNFCSFHLTSNNA